MHFYHDATTAVFKSLVGNIQKCADIYGLDVNICSEFIHVPGFSIHRFLDFAITVLRILK